MYLNVLSAKMIVKFKVYIAKNCPNLCCTHKLGQFTSGDIILLFAFTGLVTTELQIWILSNIYLLVIA